MGSAADNHERQQQEARRSDSEISKTDRQLLIELVQRVRRTETRVTKVANHLGVDAGGEKPTFDTVTHTLNVPSRKTSLDDMIAAVPVAHQSMVNVMCGGDYLLTFSV